MEILSNNPIKQKKKFKILRFLAGLFYFIGGLSIIVGFAILFTGELNITYVLSGISAGIFLIFLSEIAYILLSIEENTRK